MKNLSEILFCCVLRYGSATREVELAKSETIRWNGNHLGN